MVVFATVNAASPCSDKLIGLWGAEVSFGPEVRGTLTISRQQSSWYASIGGFDVPIQMTDSALRFNLPGSRGEFRGQFDTRSQRIRGQWIQPMTAHVWGTVYATPVELTLAGRNTWRGQVRPLDDSEGIYLFLSRSAAGTLDGFLRSPERNLGNYLGPMHLECDAGRLQLVRAKGGEPLNASYDKEQDILSVYLPTEGATFDLTRRARNTASGFYSRIESSSSYVYRQPQNRDDGWSTATLTYVGIKSEPIFELVHQLVDTPISDVAAPYPQAFLIARHGKLVLEEYFFGFHAERVHDVRSAGKTIMTTLVGAELQRGASFTLNTKVVSLFPQYSGIKSDVPDKRAITIEHLLTMTSGLDADDDKDSSPGTEDRLVAEKDRYKFTLDLPMAHPPGQKGIYSAAGINLLGGILQNTAHMWLPDFIFQRFALPLDIHHYHVPLAPSGDAYMAGGMLMRPRDFLKMGQLFLSQGRWRGRQIVSSEWTKTATRAHSSIHAEGDYGYGWWIRDVTVGGRIFHTYRAAGNGGQMVIVVPELDLVVLFMGGNYNQGPVWYRWNDEYVPKIIIPSVIKTEPVNKN